jgi:hypothetical protein
MANEDFTECMGNPRLSMTIEIATPPEAFRNIEEDGNFGHK